MRLTGRSVDLHSSAWLSGPVGKPVGIGLHFFDELARENDLIVQQAAGLIPDVSSLRGPHYQREQLSQGVADFYQQTSGYELDAWSQWSGVFRPFGWALAILFSRRLQQLNVPLSGLDTSHGITSTVINLQDRQTHQVLYAAWLRQLVGSKDVLYAGAYSTCAVPGFAGECVKVVFPLPNGNGIVIMYPESREDGSLLLTSAGKHFGDPGFYFTVCRAGKVFARYVRAIQESIEVYEAGPSEVRANHVLRLFGIPFLRLHYRLRRNAAATIPSAASS